MTNEIRTHSQPPLYPLLTSKERISIWEKAKGMWKNRKPNPLRELQKIRSEWNRRFPSPRQSL